MGQFKTVNYILEQGSVLISLREYGFKTSLSKRNFTVTRDLTLSFKFHVQQLMKSNLWKMKLKFMFSV